MTYMAASRTPRAALALFGLVAALFLLQIGALISEVFADSLPVPSVPRDPDSDTVAATAAEFRVDESGGATYSIPIYGVPGTAGVMPKLALSYSSQGGAGPIGKGWSISGLSSITRCRATMEAGDFISGGSPAPVNFTASDRYCLDGQRLLPAQANSAACPAVGGMTAQNLRTEVESFQRICAYTPSGGTAGVAFFTVNRKDGSTSWYGDRVVSATQNLGYNGYVKSTAPGKGAFALTWAQTRFQDSAGNYMDFVYSSPSSGEHLLGEVRYTGKTVLPGQTGSAQSPYAKIQFVYSQRPAAQQSTGYVAGGLVTQKWRLDAIVSCTNYGSNCLGDPAYHARYYQLNYATAVSGSGQVLLDSIQECRDSSKEICLPATYFDWSTARYEFATLERAANLPITPSYYEGHKMADVNGDGRQDFVYLRQGNINCATNFLIVAPATLDSAGRATFDFSSGSSMCLPASIQERGEGAWHLVDYTGDGRDDLFVSGPTGEGWRLFPSIGNGFNTAQNLIASIPIPSVQGRNDQVQLADLNGDGLIDIVYPRSGALRARIMARSGTSFAWGGERVVTVDPASLGPLPCQYYDSCTRSIAGAPTPKTGFVQLSDFNADAASDLLLQVTHRWVEEGDPCEPELRLLSGTQLQAADGSLLYSYAREEELQVREGSDVVAMRPPCRGEVHVSSTALHEMVVKSITPTTVTVASYASMGGNPYALALGDVNGDGLTEIFHRQSSGAAWTYRVNTGAGIGTPSTLPASEYEEQTRFADANGDGRTDILQVVNTGTGKTYYAYFALPAGGFSVRSPILGGNARICEGSGCNEDLKAPMFNDFDGDGVLDFMSIKLGDNGDMFVSRANQRFAPRDTIVRITNGLGAITQLLYAPLTNAAVYRRETGTRNASNWGRGSPVLDFLAPTYVVAAASSSSPQAGNYSAMATLYYRYANAKFQGGGRGFLGFKEIVTTDPNESGGYVTTQTLYAQSFPYTGMPIETSRWVMPIACDRKRTPSSRSINSTVCGGSMPGSGGWWWIAYENTVPRPDATCQSQFVE